MAESSYITCNGLYSNPSNCNNFKSNYGHITKYLSLAKKALTVAEAIDIYVQQLNEKMLLGEDDLSCLVNETKSIISKMNTLYPCIHLRTTKKARPVKWDNDFRKKLATGLYLLTPQIPCGLGVVKLECCLFILCENYCDICEIKLTNEYIEKWCCIAQHLRTIAKYLNEYFC